jgi:hypothetical protein
MMSYAQRIYPKNPIYESFAQRLADEIRNPHDGTAEPLIILESQGQQAPTHLYVIWKEWGQLTQLERSEIVLEAYREAKGSNLASSLRVALGLTSEEAERMGIHYAPLEAAA